MSIIRLAKEFVVKVWSHVEDKTIVVARCTDFSLSLGKNTVDITSFDSAGFEEFLSDNKNWNITFGSMVTRGSASGGFIALFDEWGTGDYPITVGIGPTATGLPTGEFFEGSGILTDLSADGSVGDKATYSGTIQGSGEIKRIKLT